ncbi:hypothetical protein LX15_000855 [Streptoalloteichus tenebrarius]|uniref:Uncharacterized protein n=1 Tax=Streptoalloteichus tenebrarius (strain ATCC 17920 / DSM 40477 / JCM 4838 / CBS 697.72 / NBRC 16177 / NCIMB 11028 / NRRL B-12390 / A12253. 1 / ISP 5477) TaxID=1933 RepID=A0ABT1HNT4_STRSD|nr:hypothetical protein [Streptoalloteichus tenebrarius]MCP2257170.1 hypothetical protein [Streptoalloteichus tenebrarius]BFE98804.1 hypothetical protein GCM10020241_04800 [Streptoalloteichus tenebrarius]
MTDPGNTSNTLGASTHGQDEDQRSSEDASKQKSFEELTRPLFFAGQMLTEDDLTTLVTWVRNKRWLASLRQGWGVVRGLELSADKDATINIGPGHAVTANGDDVVVPKAHVEDLSKACGSDTSCVVDLVLRYDEKSFRPTRGLRPPSPHSAQDSTCGSVNGEGGGGGDCHDSRMAEKYRVDVRPVSGEGDLPDWKEWKKRYEEAVRPLQKAIDDKFPADIPVNKRRDWLKAVMPKPPHRYAFLPLAVEQAEMSERNCLELLLWIVLEQIDRLVRGPVPPEQAGDVRLGRVWLTRPNDQSLWKIHDIRTTRPYRTLFGSPTKPAPSGQTNLTEILGGDMDEIDGVLAQHGVTVSEWVEWVPETNQKLKQMFANAPCAEKGALVRLSYIQSNLSQVPKGRRWIVGMTNLVKEG